MRNVETDDRVSFHMAEFGALKSEIAELVKQTGSYMTFAVTASGGIAAWLLTHAMEPNVVKFARWLPFLTSTLFGCFALAAYLRIGEKGRYLRRIEDKLAFDDLGWEKTFERRTPAIGVFQFIGWAVLNSSTLFAAVAIPFPVEVGPAAVPASQFRCPTSREEAIRSSATACSSQSSFASANPVGARKVKTASLPPKTDLETDLSGLTDR